jgi:hypothetical protein
MEGIARQPEAAPKIQGAMIIAAALIEGVALFARRHLPHEPSKRRPSHGRMDMADSIARRVDTRTSGWPPWTHPAGAARANMRRPRPSPRSSGTMVGLTWLTFGLLAARPLQGGLETDPHRAWRQARSTPSATVPGRGAPNARDEYWPASKQQRRRPHRRRRRQGQGHRRPGPARPRRPPRRPPSSTKARDEAQILLANAQRELKAAHEKALADLRRESADLAIGLSRKIIGESLDEKKSRDLVDRLIKTV